MNKIIVFLLFSTSISLCKGQIVIPDSAKYHVGSLTIVCGKVMSTFLSKSNTIFLNFGNSYPNETFTAVIMTKDIANFKYNPVEHLKNKQICVTGMIKMYKGKPEIIIKSQNQIREQ